MSRPKSYADEQLVEAITSSRSWRGVLRELGLASGSSSSIASVRAQADRIGADYSHFRRHGRWTQQELRRAIAQARSWDKVAEQLGPDAAIESSALKGHAARLGLDVSHLARTESTTETHRREAQPSFLDRAGPMLAAAWFTLRGCDVSWPLEPCRYDLLVGMDGTLHRIQVKTTTVRTGNTWKVFLSSARRGRRTYSPDEIDEFFIVDGGLNYYLIPIQVVGGRHAIHLSAYEQFGLSPLA